MILHYDVNGVPITTEQWCVLFSNEEYRRIGSWEGEGGVLVSTVWLGINHNFWDGPPLIFETMIFGLPGDEEYQERYSTQGAAREGHWKTVENVINGERIWFT